MRFFALALISLPTPQTPRTDLEAQLRRWPAGVVVRIAESARPNADGALGRNRQGYFHVRFQLGISALADAAVIGRRHDLAADAVRALEYSARFETGAGDFRLQIPPRMLGAPNAGDRASARAFFLSDAGSAVLALERSDWFQQLPAADSLRQRLRQLHPVYARALSRLVADSALLRRTDARAPNRLFFDALAYTAMGNWLGDSTAQRLGVGFSQRALALQRPEGWFVEGEGWDSSYQGVALARAWRLWALLSDSTHAEELGAALDRGTRWFASRILANGEISAEGNTRVYPGGEAFLGQEKRVAWIDGLRALNSAAAARNSAPYFALGERVRRHYAPRD